jgi:hypothetical protein
MNTGIGDAVNLSWKLASVLQGSADETILDTYEFERIRFARKLVATTDRIFSLVTNPNPVAAWMRTSVLPLLLPRLVSVGRFRRALFRTMSQIGIRYRKSSISTGSTGTVRGGDRLPWLRLASGEDNFASIIGAVWRVHAYGEQLGGIDKACADLGLTFTQFSWEAAMGDAGLARGGLYLLRPDSYVALAGIRCTPERLHEYFEERGLRVAHPPATMPLQSI